MLWIPLLFCFICAASRAPQRTEAQTSSPTRIVIVQFGDQSVSVNDTSSSFDAAPELDGATLRNAVKNVGLYIYQLDANSSVTPADFCKDLHEDQAILICEPDQTFTLDQTITPVPAVSNDALSGSQWGLAATGIPDAWSSGITGIGKVRVSILSCMFVIVPLFARL